MTRPASILFLNLIWVLATAAGAQSFPASILPETLVSNLPTTDDVVVRNDGTLVVSYPQLHQLATYDPATPAILPVPLPIAPALVLGMDLAPSGDLLLGDSIAGTLDRLDLATLQRQTVATGFNIPIEVFAESDDVVWVGDLRNSDFFTGPCDLHRLTLSGGQLVSDVIVIPGIIGAIDIALGPDGTLYLSTLAATTVFAIAPGLGSGTTLGHDLFLPSDLMIDGEGRLLVTTIHEGRLFEIDLDDGEQREVVGPLAPGAGAEDMALTTGGSLYVTMSGGTIHRIDRGSVLTQCGTARPGTSFALRLHATAAPGHVYALAASLTSTQGITIPGTSAILPLDPDGLFYYSLSQPRPAPLEGFDGLTDLEGRAEALVHLPAVPQLVGATCSYAGVLLPSLLAPLSTWIPTNLVRVEVRP